MTVNFPFRNVFFFQFGTSKVINYNASGSLVDDQMDSVSRHCLVSVVVKGFFPEIWFEQVSLAHYKHSCCLLTAFCHTCSHMSKCKSCMLFCWTQPCSCNTYKFSYRAITLHIIISWHQVCGARKPFDVAVLNTFTMRGRFFFFQATIKQRPMQCKQK